MINVLRAQFYRLMRSVAFWGLLVACAGVTILMLVSVGMQYDGSTAYGTGAGYLPVSAPLVLSAEEYAGSAAMFVPLFTSLLAARFFSDDFAEKGCRVLDAGPGFRRAYVLSAGVLVAFTALCFTVAELLVPFVVTPFFPLLDLTWDGGDTLRWVLQMVLVSTVYGVLSVAATVVTGKLGIAVLIAFLFGTGIVDLQVVSCAQAVWGELHTLGAVSGMPPFQLPPFGSPAGFSQWMPGGQLWGILSVGAAPTVTAMGIMVLQVVVALLLCWLVFRRKKV